MRREAGGVYSVDLLYERAPEIDSAALIAALQAKCPGIEPIGREPSKGLFSFVQTKHPVEFKDGEIPAQLIVCPGGRKADSVSLEESIQQSWAQKNARQLVASAPHSVFVSDMMASGLPHQERLSIFLDALDAIVGVLPCRSIHWRTSQQILTPEQFLSGRTGASGHFLFAGPLNVRFFNISNGERPGEMLADTIGLAVLGLPDIQCHFHGLDPDVVVPKLYNLGLYLFEKGDIIENGHTVAGSREEERWVCQHEDALLPPQRIVLDINPGPSFAAGGRA